MAGTASAGSTAGDGGGAGVKEQAQEKAQEVREQAGEQARKAAGEARDRVRGQVDQRSTQAGEQVGRHASDLRDVAHGLREQGKDGPARVADQVADRVDRAGSWMRESDADRILSDVEDFARSKPWAVAAGALALGFAASRVLKASSSRRYEERRTPAPVGELPPPRPAATQPAPPTPATPATPAPFDDEPRTVPASTAVPAGSRRP